MQHLSSDGLGLLAVYHACINRSCSDALTTLVQASCDVYSALIGLTDKQGHDDGFMDVLLTTQYPTFCTLLYSPFASHPGKT